MLNIITTEATNRTSNAFSLTGCLCEVMSSLPGFSESMRLVSSFRRISCAWLTSRRKMAFSLTPLMLNVRGSEPLAITSLS